MSSGTEVTATSTTGAVVVVGAATGSSAGPVSRLMANTARRMAANPMRGIQVRERPGPADCGAAVMAGDERTGGGGGGTSFPAVGAATTGSSSVMGSSVLESWALGEVEGSNGGTATGCSVEGGVAPVEGPLEGPVVGPVEGPVVGPVEGAEGGSDEGSGKIGPADSRGGGSGVGSVAGGCPVPWLSVFMGSCAALVIRRLCRCSLNER